MLRELERQGVHFAPIRHHSPACARAVSTLIDEVVPTSVLIEGPEEYTALLSQLTREETVPPVAILSTAGDSAVSNGFYPLAEYSPEWVALRRAHEIGATARFIDLAWDARPDTSNGTGNAAESDDANETALTRSIQAERYLAHSATITALAAREHCRDHDELWDHLFELRGDTGATDDDATAQPRDTSAQLGAADARVLLDDVFVWSALARLEYEPDVLVAEGSIPREALMAARIAEVRAATTGPIVVVTGAFHTLALVEALAGAPEGALVRDAAPASGYGAPRDGTGEAWLIRFDQARLDAVSGYGAGMPSPGYYSRVWASGNADPTRDILLDVARAVSSAKTTELLGISDVTAALIAARRLADLRGRARIGRTDVLDAITSTFIKDDDSGSPSLRDALRLVFVGDRLGEVPPDAAAPPMVAEVRRRVAAAGLVIADSRPRSTSLDLHRKPAHRERSRLLNLLEFLRVGFATRTAGPDFVSGRGLGRLFQEWTYAWTPLVEAQLIDAAAEGTSLDEIAVARFARAERALAENGRSASEAVALLAQVAVVGLTDHLPRLVLVVGQHLDADSSLMSVAAAGRRLLQLFGARDELQLGDSEQFARLIEKAVAAIAFAVPTLGEMPQTDDDAAVSMIVELREFASRVDEQTGLDVEPVRRELERLRSVAESSPAVRGALTALVAVDGALSDVSLADTLISDLGAGADVDRAMRFLSGFLRAAPDLLLRDPVVFDAIQVGVEQLPEEAFLTYLPELRRSFGWLRPVETASLAERLVGRGAAVLTATSGGLTSGDLSEGIVLHRALATALAADGLKGWAGETL
ncbi:hypothetical protein ASF54_00120 [Frondihabitans sp. Leaf304]|nr:hypothetical protein ASF54_00120 [Frondihabitans sp. Leaf304]